MNVTVQLTLDGMIRALRWKAHDLAEDVERRDRRNDNEQRASRSKAIRPEADDDIRGE